MKTTNLYGEGRSMRARSSAARIALRDDLGQSLVELALGLPLLLLLLIGIADFGWMAYCYIELGNATNAGAQYAAQSVTTAGDGPGIQATVQSDAANLPSAKITTTSSNACVCIPSGSATGTIFTCSAYATACVPPSRIIAQVTVTSSMPISPFIPWQGFGIYKSTSIGTSITLHSSATMQVQQ